MHDRYRFALETYSQSDDDNDDYGGLVIDFVIVVLVLGSFPRNASMERMKMRANQNNVKLNGGAQTIVD